MSPRIFDAFIFLSEEKGLPISEIIASYQSVENAELVFAETGNIECDIFDKDIYNQIQDLCSDDISTR